MRQNKRPFNVLFLRLTSGTEKQKNHFHSMFQNKTTFIMMQQQ